MTPEARGAPGAPGAEASTRAFTPVSEQTLSACVDQGVHWGGGRSCTQTLFQAAHSWEKVAARDCAKCAGHTWLPSGDDIPYMLWANACHCAAWVPKAEAVADDMFSIAMAGSPRHWDWAGGAQGYGGAGVEGTWTPRI